MNWKKIAGSAAVFVALGGGVYALASWKLDSFAQQAAQAEAMPEHRETVDQLYEAIHHESKNGQ